MDGTGKGDAVDVTRPGLGEVCAHCGNGRYHVFSTRIYHERKLRARFIRCNKCGYRPEHNKLLVPLELAPPQLGPQDPDNS